MEFMVKIIFIVSFCVLGVVVVLIGGMIFFFGFVMIVLIFMVFLGSFIYDIGVF